MLRATAIAASIASLPASAPAQEVLSGEGMAGVGVQGCETIAGVENAPVLAAAVDWGLGYLAGRRDGGHTPVEGEPLSTTDPADLATGLVLYCREHPRGLVLDALRAYGERVFAEGPEAGRDTGLRLPRVRPPARPADAPILAAAADGALRNGEPGAGPGVAARMRSTAIARPEVMGGSLGTGAAAAARRAAADAGLALARSRVDGPIPPPARVEAASLASRAGGARDVRLVGVGVGTGTSPYAPETSPLPPPRP